MQMHISIQMYKNRFLPLSSITDAPKLTEVIHNMTNRWQSDGGSPVALTCHSHSYPPVNSYKWYRLVEEREHFIINHQNITVHPDKPGTYYCVATNNMGGKESGRVKLFLNRECIVTDSHFGKSIEYRSVTYSD